MNGAPVVARLPTAAAIFSRVHIRPIPVQMFGKAKESRNDLVEEDAPPGWLRATEHGDRTLMEGRARRVHSPTARLERLDEGEIEALERAIAIVDRVLQERPRPTGAAGGETEA